MLRRLTAPLAGCVLVLSACGDLTEVAAPDAPLAPALSVQQEAERVVPGRVLVGLADGTDAATFAESQGIAFEAEGPRGAFGIFRGAVGSERALAARLGEDPRVVFAEPDYLRQTTAIDPRMWAFYNPGGLSVAYTRGRNSGSPVSSYLSVDDADEDNVEGYAAGGGAVSIASIDTGVQLDHAEFGQATIVAGWDFFDNDADPSDSNDHGTHTTGTMAGDRVGVAGVAGAASNVTVYVYRVCGSIGCPTSAIVNAIYAATDAGVVAMNLSLGGGSLSQSEAAAIQYATNNDALVIAAAGNDGTSTVSCPACDPNAMSVAASDWLDQHAYYTNWGSGLDIIAPGGELYSNTTSEAGIWSAVRGNGYAYFQGTSMATPQVTGTAAIVASATGLRGAALRARIESTTDDLGANGYDTQFGHGRLNSYRAVTNNTLSEGPPPPPPDPLAASFTFSCDLTVCDFDGGGSTGEITDHTWSGAFDASGPTATHDFGGTGEFDVTLTVSDGSGTDSATQTVSCRQRGQRVRCN